MPKLRRSEWLLIVFFAYIAALIPIFRDRPRLGLQPLLVFTLVCLLLLALAWAEQTRYAQAISIARDWIPMGLTLAAFREMELLVPIRYDLPYETGWMHWDDIVLRQWGLKHAIESLGGVIPTYLELCYLLVYGLGAFCVLTIWLRARRQQIDSFYVVLLVGTLLAYALFPYFPSRPPRLVFPTLDQPSFNGIFRRLNVFLLNRATIHTGVFPSAHVSSAFAAAWAMFTVMPRKKVYGWLLTVYAISVAIATIYGRYHYAADALAGLIVSFVAAQAAWLLAGQHPSTYDRHTPRSDPHLVA